MGRYVGCKTGQSIERDKTLAQDPIEAAALDKVLICFRGDAFSGLTGDVLVARSDGEAVTKHPSGFTGRSIWASELDLKRKAELGVESPAC